MTEGSFSAKKKERVALRRLYQIDQQRAVQQFRQLAREENPSIQMIFPMAEVVGLLQDGRRSASRTGFSLLVFACDGLNPTG